MLANILTPLRPEVRRELTLIGYSTGNLGKNIMHSGIDVTLLFLITDILSVPPIVVSYLMAVQIAGDVVFNFGSGYLADLGLRHNFGYSKIVAIGAVPCCLAFAGLFSLPALGLHGRYVICALAVALLAFRASYAVIDVPHNSLLTQISQDSRARGRISGYRFFFSTLASISVAAILAPAVITAAHAGSKVQLSLLGIAGGVIACTALLVTAWACRNARAQSRGAGQRIALLPKFDALFGCMTAIAIVTGFAAPTFTRMIIYLATYVYREPSLASDLLLANTFGQVLGIVLWTYLVHHHEKTVLLAASYAVAAIGLGVLASAPAVPTILASITCMIGVGSAGVFMLPWGILADTVDFSEFRHHERREAATFAAFLVVLKASSVASIGVIGLALSNLGYVPGLAQTHRVLVGIRLMAFGFPIIGSAIAILVLSRMSIGHRTHAKIVRALQSKCAGKQ